MNIKNQLVGRWDVVSHGYYDETKKFITTSDNLKGRLLYSEDYSMSVLITKVDNPRYSSDIITYSGRYTIKDDLIIHHIDVSLFDERNGTDEVRYFSLEDNYLILTTDLIKGHLFEIKWKKSL